METIKSKWTLMHTAALWVVFALIVLVAAQTQGPEMIDKAAPWTWYGVLVLLALLIVIAGQGIVGTWSGFLVDARNKMTLSRLQLVLWTVLVLAAYLTAVMARIGTAGTAALDIALPQELWWLMGISTTSMVGSSLILSNKKSQVTDKSEEKRTVKMLAAQEGKPESLAAKSAVGAVMTNEAPEDARLADLFRGDETGNAAYLDLGKVQMLFFTVIVVLAYFFTLRGSFSDIVNGVIDASGKRVFEFPALNNSIVTLLGISHAGYLAHKAVPHSKPG